jgi:hypothetical protein
MQALAVLIDGRLQLANGDTRALAAPMSGIDQIVDGLAHIVALAQQLNESDARRAREFVRIALATMTASTSLPDRDQQQFMGALRQARR